MWCSLVRNRSDLAAEAAMTMEWPDTLHFICEWHFMKNLKENLAAKLGPVWEVRHVGVSCLPVLLMNAKPDPVSTAAEWAL
jgi:hypothetical protein